MIGFLRAMKFGGALVAATLMLAGASTQSHAQTTGTVSIRVVKVGFIVGGGGGRGTLNFAGHHYPFRVGGISIGTIGISEARLSGTASNLHRPRDIAGTYAAAGAGLAVIGGAQVATLQNEHGVILRLQGTQIGFNANLGVGGMTISMH